MRSARWLAGAWLLACAPGGEVLEATVSSYSAQDAGGVRQGAWGDELRPGMKALAVSERLVARGLVHRTEVRVEGLPGSYTVLDRLPPGSGIDAAVYVGAPTPASRAWGTRRAKLYWEAPEEAPGDGPALNPAADLS